MQCIQRNPEMTWNVWLRAAESGCYCLGWKGGLPYSLCHEGAGGLLSTVSLRNGPIDPRKPALLLAPAPEGLGSQRRPQPSRTRRLACTLLTSIKMIKQAMEIVHSQSLPISIASRIFSSLSGLTRKSLANRALRSAILLPLAMVLARAFSMRTISLLMCPASRSRRLTL